MKEAAEGKVRSEELAPTQTSTQEELDALREILVGPEKRELDALKHELEAKSVEAADVGQVLPEAILLRSEKDGRLADALRPTIENSIEGSVRRNPKVLADAIFPLMGPAIRRSIRQTLAGFLEGLNRSLEHSFSVKGLRWRFEARRTGKPFSEIVLKYSLVFRVEQVFLIHRESGILLEHETAPTAQAADPDLISSMLGALQDFMSDSFDKDGEKRIQNVDLGDLLLVVAQGPQAILACMVRGLPRTSLRTRMEEVIEAVHAERGDDLSNFDGDVQPFAAARPLLENCFMEQRAESPKRRSMRPGTVVVAVAILALTVIGALWIVRTLHRGSVWRNVVQEVAAEPGIVLLSSGSDGGRYALSGLLDPLARDPLEIVSATGLDPDLVDASWETYYSVAPHLVQLRARTLLEPPDTVFVELRDGVLRVEGSADHEWVRRADTLLGALPGVSSVHFDVDDLDLEAARSRAKAVERRTVAFAQGADEVDVSSAQTKELAEELRALADAAELTEASLAIVVTGFRAADEDEQLDRERAEALQGVLERLSEGRAWVHASAGGVAEAVAPHMGRKATLNVRLIEDRALDRERR